MFLRAPLLVRFPVLAALALAAAGSAQAQLAARSPFHPPQAEVSPNAPTEGAPLEFVGYMETSEGMQFRIFDPAKKSGVWVKLNERNPDFDVIVKGRDGEQNTLTIEHQGKTLTLAERKAKVVSSGSSANAMPPPPMPMPANVPPAVTQSVVLNPTPADEQRRLEAVAAEVARRRALREQATNNINRGVTPNVSVPVAAPQVVQPMQQQPAPVVVPPPSGQYNQRRR